MHRLLENGKTIIEMRTKGGPAMTGEPFPCALVTVKARDVGSAVDRFLEHRGDARWVLIGHHAVQSHAQLWTAWIQTTRNELRSSMVARSVDAEFLRYISGTHHISEAFSRAGVGSEDALAWVVVVDSVFHSDLDTLLSTLGWQKEAPEMHLSIAGMRRLGIDVDGWPDSRLGEALLSHVLMADDQSSSHR
jgi:hypothetical protein